MLGSSTAESVTAPPEVRLPPVALASIVSLILFDVPAPAPAKWIGALLEPLCALPPPLVIAPATLMTVITGVEVALKLIGPAGALIVASVAFAWTSVAVSVSAADAPAEIFPAGGWFWLICC